MSAINQCYDVWVQLRYNFRLYPTPGQRQSLAKAFGCARVVFNDGLAARQKAHTAGMPYLPDGALLKQVTTDAKRTPQRAWLGEVSAVVLQQAVADLNIAYRNFFDSLSGKRKGSGVAPPRFRSRKDQRQSIRFTRNARFTVTTGGRLSLPKIGEIPLRWSRELPSEPSSVTVIKDAAGRYYASFVVQAQDTPLPERAEEVGIDLGLTSFAVLSNGKVFANPRFLRRAERKLRKAQRSLCRKQKGSNNRAKARVKVARTHSAVRDTRRDWLHKTTTTIIRDNQAGVRGGPRSQRARTNPAGEIGTRCRMVHVPRHAGIQGHPAWTDVLQDRPLVPLHPDMLGMRDHRHSEAPQRPGVDLPLRHDPRPGSERGPQHTRGGTRREPKRLWNADKTGDPPGTACRSRNPPTPPPGGSRNPQP